MVHLAGQAPDRTLRTSTGLFQMRQPRRARFTWRIALLTLLVSACISLLHATSGLFAHKEVAPYTPLMAAAADGDLAAVRALMDQGVDVNEQLKLVNRPGIRVSLHGGQHPPHGQTALMIALERSRVDVVQALLERGARTSLVRSDKWRGTWDSIQFIPFPKDDHTSDVRMLQLLLKYADEPLPSQKAYELLGRAIKAGDLAATQILLPFVIAQFSGDREKMSALYCSAMPDGSVESDSYVIAVLESLRPFAGDVSSIPPHCAMAASTPRKLQYLLERGMDPNRQDKNGMRPLSYQLAGLEHSGSQTVPRLKLELVALLLKHGADPRLSEAPSPSALERAHRIRSPELNKLFYAFSLGQSDDKAAGGTSNASMETTAPRKPEDASHFVR